MKSVPVTIINERPEGTGGCEIIVTAAGQPDTTLQPGQRTTIDVRKDRGISIGIGIDLDAGAPTDNGLKKLIAEGRDKVIELKKKRDDINAKISEVRTSLEAKGITKAAFDNALRYFEKDPDKRDGYDNAYIIARDAMGLPVKGAQLQLFEEDAHADEKTVN